MDFKYSGIILAKKDILEVDRLYIIYTREAGKLAVVGKGVRKSTAKLAGNLEPITQSEIFVAKGKGRGNITGAIAINNFPAIKENLESLERVFQVFFMAEKIIGNEEKDEEVFDLLLKYLEIVEKISEQGSMRTKLDVVTQGFVFKLLDKLGYKVEVERCVMRGERLVAGNNFFSAEKGGVICSNCARSISRKIKISDSSIKLIRIFLANKLENLVKIDVEKNILDNLKIISQEMIRWIM